MTTSTQIDKIFQAGGVLSQSLESYVPRSGQIDLAKSITKAMREEKHVFAEGPCGCLHGGTVIYDPVAKTSKTVRERFESGGRFHVWALGPDGPVITGAKSPVRYESGQMARITMKNGRVLTVTMNHRLWSGSGWIFVYEAYERLQGSSPVLLPTNSDSDLETHAVDAFRWSETIPGSLDGCHPSSRSYGERLLGDQGNDQEFVPSQVGVREHSRPSLTEGDEASTEECSRHHRSSFHPSSDDFEVQSSLLSQTPLGAPSRQGRGQLFGSVAEKTQGAQQLDRESTHPRKEQAPSLCAQASTSASSSSTSRVERSNVTWTHKTGGEEVVAVESIELLGREEYFDFHVPIFNSYWCNGLWHHNCGKSFAYLVPAILTSLETGCKVVVATANIALQEQIFHKDLPFLQKHLGLDFKFALMKGKNNYFCRDRSDSFSEDIEHGGFPGGHVELDQHETILSWARKTTTGDMSELPFKPKGSVWGKVCGAFEDCDAKNCQKKQCFSFKAKKRAAEANIVVCNYHILFAHLQIKDKTGLDLILPNFDYVIFDEGHEAEDIARNFFGTTIRQGSITALARKINDKKIKDEVKAAADIWRKALKVVHEHKDYDIRLREGDGHLFDILREGARPVMAISLSCLRWWGREINHSIQIGASEEHINKCEANRRRISNLRQSISDILGLEGDGSDHEVEIDVEALKDMGIKIDEDQSPRRRVDPSSVIWIERREFKRMERFDLIANPIDVSYTIRNLLFDEYKSVVVTSATLTSGNSFKFMRDRLGVGKDPRVLESKVKSPFNFREQALFVIPQIGVAPNHEEWQERMADMFQDIIDTVGGRTLGLFTSYRNLNYVAERLKHTGNIYVQGTLPRTMLLKKFTEETDSVLLGTSSFWTGVDVPGESLSCVVIDKLPFPSPGDPVVNAINEGDDRSFFNFSIPKAVIHFRQGFGRLIRSNDCRGVVVCFDERLSTKSYGVTFVKSVPKCRKSRKLSSIADMLAKGPSLS